MAFGNNNITLYLVADKLDDNVLLQNVVVPVRQEPLRSHPADTFSQELAALAAQISGAWQGPQDAAAAIREQRRELGTDVNGH